jgi:hypothetical protein
VELSSISNILWRERNLLDLLLFKLEEEQLILAAGRTRWLPSATHEVEMVLEELKAAELARAVVIDELALDLGLPPGPSLRDLAAACPPPWDDLLEQHRTAFLLATQEIGDLARANRDLLGHGAQATQEALTMLVGAEPAPHTYAPPGGPIRPRHAAPRLLDEVV